MTRSFVLVGALISLSMAAPAAAQSLREPVVGYASPLEAHRYGIDRMRIEADARSAYQRQQSLNARLTWMEVESRRAPALAVDPTPPSAETLEQARARREAATQRRTQVETGTREIDGWLDRAPD